jgi:hypothetical protein
MVLTAVAVAIVGVVVLRGGTWLRLAPASSLPERAEMVCKSEVTHCHHRLPIRRSLQKLFVISKDEI